jgi:hypothetical protein
MHFGGWGYMEINYYGLARQNFESNLIPDKPATPEAERRNLYAGLVALTFAVENHLNEIMKAVRKGED